MRVLVFENACIGPTADSCAGYSCAGCGGVIIRTEGHGSVSLTGNIEDAYAFCGECWPIARAVIRRLNQDRYEAILKEEKLWAEFLRKQMTREDGG